ncbi:MAG: MBL fold metallo-hydrolase [Chloroflexota bacterium]
MIVEMLTVGQLQTNCFIVVCEDTRKAVVIDPGGDARIILNAVKRLQADVQYVVDTHGHFDHTLANDEVKEATGARLGIHPSELPVLKSSLQGMAAWLRIKLPDTKPDFFLNEGDELKVGNITFRILHTPGHSPGHITLVTDGKAFVGDCLFYQGIGRTDLPGGSYDQLMDSIHNKLLPLGNDTVVYPGHGPITTIGQERRMNPWLVT